MDKKIGQGNQKGPFLVEKKYRRNLIWIIFPLRCC